MNTELNIALVTIVKRKVSQFLTVTVEGATWSIKDMPSVLVGDRVLCLPTPDRSHLCVCSSQGPVIFQWAVLLPRDDFGFPADAPLLGRPHAAGGSEAYVPPCTATRAQQIDDMATLLLEVAENLSPAGAPDCDMGHEALLAALARRMGPVDYASFLRSMPSSSRAGAAA